MSIRDVNVLVISDTHGQSGAIREVLEKLPFRPSAVLFLGDGARDLDLLNAERYAGVDVYAVAGNLDMGATDAPTERTVDIDGCRILMMHGNLYSVGMGHGAAVRHAAGLGADVLLFGHTHKRCSYTVSAEETGNGKPLLVGNPGSLGQPRDGREPSYGLLTIRGGVPLFSHGCLD